MSYTEVKNLFKQLADKVSLHQYTWIMNSDLDFKAKAEQFKMISKAKIVREYADRIIHICECLEAT